MTLYEKKNFSIIAETKKVNHRVDYILCPPNCGDEATVVGRSAYHPDSTLCAAAVLDGSIPPSGGLVGIMLIPGRESYE